MKRRRHEWVTARQFDRIVFVNPGSQPEDDTANSRRVLKLTDPPRTYYAPLVDARLDDEPVRSK